MDLDLAVSAKPDEEMKRFEERTRKSKGLFADARIHVPLGVYSKQRGTDFGFELEQTPKLVRMICDTGKSFAYCLS